MVILGKAGGAGAGKTVLAARLVLDLLAQREAGGPVPVLFSVASWNSADTSLWEWLIEQFARDYPALASKRRGRASLAAMLIDEDRIIPILDGFDEIAEGLREQALERLNAAATMPLVVTSRPDEYAAAVNSARVLANAAGIELLDLNFAHVAEYLIRTAPPHSDGGVWVAIHRGRALPARC